MYHDGRFEGDDDFLESFEWYEGHDEDIIVEELDGKMTRVRRVDEDVDPVMGAGPRREFGLGVPTVAAVGVRMLNMRLVSCTAFLRSHQVVCSRMYGFFC